MFLFRYPLQFASISAICISSNFSDISIANSQFHTLTPVYACNFCRDFRCNFFFLMEVKEWMTNVQMQRVLWTFITHVLLYSGADKWKYCAFCEESTILTVCVDFDTSMNIRYGGICEINANSQKFGISDILL